MDLQDLRAANRARLPLFTNRHGQPAHTRPDGSDWSPAQWVQALLGELGEFARVRLLYETGDMSEEDYRREAGKELADVQTYLDLLALRCFDVPDPAAVVLYDSPARALLRMVADLGEYANDRKKLDRGEYTAPADTSEAFRRLGVSLNRAAGHLTLLSAYVRDSTLTHPQLADQVAAHPDGLDLNRATVEKFNEVSERVGCDVRLAAAQRIASHITAMYETGPDATTGGAVGTTSAPIKRLEWQDDGSITVVIDGWPAPPAQSPEREALDQCDEDVFMNGVSLGFFDMTKEQAEQYCKSETERTGRKHDWHYVAGRVHIKAMREALAASKPEPPDGVRTCNFCGCETNAKRRACCDRGRTADDSKQEPMRPAGAEDQSVYQAIANNYRKPEPQSYPPCKGMNCGCTDGVSHSLECQAEHAAAIAGGVFVKPEPQAQAEPEVVQRQYQDKDGTWCNFVNQKHYDDMVAAGGWPIRELITLQSHREAIAKLQAEVDKWSDRAAKRTDDWHEAIAKKDAALKACVKALETCNPGDYSTGHVIDPSFDEKLVDAAITQAEEARK